MRFIIVSIIILTSVLTHGQKFIGGVSFGLCGTEVSGDRLEGPNKPGITFGGLVNYPISQHSAFQLELNYIQKGSKASPDPVNFSSYLLRLNYVEMPFHYVYTVNDKFSLESGLAYGVLIQDYFEANGSQQTIIPDFEKGDLSFNIGGYYAFNEKWQLNIRYSNSILPVRKRTSGLTYLLKRGEYNEVLGFTFQYRFN